MFRHEGVAHRYGRVGRRYRTRGICEIASGYEVSVSRESAERERERKREREKERGGHAAEREGERESERVRAGRMRERGRESERGALLAHVCSNTESARGHSFMKSSGRTIWSSGEIRGREGEVRRETVQRCRHNGSLSTQCSTKVYEKMQDETMRMGPASGFR